MKHEDPARPTSDESDRLIEAWLDGELTETEHRLLVERAATDADLRDRMHAARMVRSLFEGFPAENFPTDRLDHVLTSARRDARRDAIRQVTGWFRSVLSGDWRPALAMATLVAVTLVAALVTRPTPGVPADPEVARALQEVKWTLGYLADVGRRTGDSVRSRVLEPHLVQPMRDAVAHVLDDPQPLNLKNP